RPRVLALRGAEGVEAGAAETLEFAGAEALPPPASAAAAAALSPDWVIAADDAFWVQARRDPDWQAVAAVREGRLVRAPALPFGWLGRPPSVNRLLGLLWLPVLFGLGDAAALPERIAAAQAALYHRQPAPEAVALLLREALPGPRSR
ncbi:MAG TPA: hypothetical protein VE684_15060, partial [Crenalkalicoccus sp.]|nr:hypothetical protein [Crenalkalicoccus sp.]